jgi:sugar phosphate isomerase/epimerase
MTVPLTNLDRLCIHTMTNKPWTLRECIEGYTAAGVSAVTVWRQVVDAVGVKQAALMLSESGLRITSLCRGGFFPAATAGKRQAAIDDNKVMIDMATAIGAPLIVLVCGADPALPLEESRKQIADGIAAVLPHAQAAGVRLGIEPLHPMYADDRSAVNTMAQANDMVEALGHANIGVAVDVYHLWWDPALEAEIKRCGGSIFAFHVCDWRTPTRDLLTDRGLMGEGCIDIPRIRGWVESSGFTGDIEVEIFSEEFWATDQTEYLAKIKAAYLKSV